MSERRLPDPRMRDEFRRELRARLMREAALTLTPRRRDTAWTTWLRPAFAGLAALVLVIGTGSAAAGSVSGDATFGLKRAIEEVRVALTFDGVARVRVLADITDERLDELQRVAGSDDKAPAASEAYAEAVTRFRLAVDTLQEKAPQAQSDEAQEVVDQNRDRHEVVLDELKGRLPEKAKPNVERAIEEERKDTQNTKNRNDKENNGDGEQRDGGQNQNQGASPRGLASPRPTERAATPRPTSSPRSTQRDDSD